MAELDPPPQSLGSSKSFGKHKSYDHNKHGCGHGNGNGGQFAPC